MKKILSTFLLLIAFAVNAFPQGINVSTGVTSTGAAIATGSPNPLWQITAGPILTPATPLVIPHFTGAWQIPPVAVTNAGWINHSGSPYQGSVPGIYTFERRFEVLPGTCSFTYDLAVTTDDSLVSIQFVDPFGSIIPLSATYMGNPYHLDPVLGNTVNGPLPGSWRLRVVTHFIDNAAGLLVSGFVNTGGQSCFAANNQSYQQIPNNITYNGLYTAWPAKVYIAPNTTVTVLNGTLDVTNSDVVLGECASIIIGAGARLRANNSVFRPCCEAQTWQGIRFQNGGRGEVNQCTFKQALRALDFQGSPAVASSFNVRITDNSFINCRRGISASSCTLAEAITGNNFTIDQRNINYNPPCEPSPAYNNQHFGIQGIAAQFRGLVAQNHFVNTSEIGSLRNFLGVHWSTCSGVVSQNTFSNMFTAVELANCNNVSVEDNHMAATMSARTSPLNQIRVSSFSNNIWITSNELVNTREYTIQTSASVPAIYIDRSRLINVKENQVEGFEIGIATRNVSNGSICENDIRNSNFIGISIENGTRLDITCNEISMRQRGGTNNAGIFYNRTLFEQPAAQPQFRNNCVSNTTFALIANKNFFANYPLPRIVNNYFYNYTNIGIYNVNMNGSVGTALSPYSNTGHNTFVSNNIPNGALDIQSANPITAYGNFGISSVSAGVTVLGNNLYNSSTACGNQIGTVSTELSEKEHCDLFTNNIEASVLRIQQGDLSILQDAGLDSDERYELGGAALGYARYLALPIADDIHALLMQEGMLTPEQAWRIHYADLLAQQRYADALVCIAAAAPLAARSDELRDELLVQHILVKALSEGRDMRSLDAADYQLLAGLAEQDAAFADLAQDLLQAHDLGHPYRFRPLEIPDFERSADDKVIVLEDAFFSVYPNPATDRVQVRYTLPDPQGAQLHVTNLLGQTMLQRPLDANAQVLEIQLDNLPSGLYQVSLLRPGASPLTQRLLKR
jgi:hypothetical protein